MHHPEAEAAKGTRRKIKGTQSTDHQEEVAYAPRKKLVQRQRKWLRSRWERQAKPSLAIQSDTVRSCQAVTSKSFLSTTMWLYFRNACSSEFGFFCMLSIIGCIPRYSISLLMAHRVTWGESELCTSPVLSSAASITKQTRGGRWFWRNRRQGKGEDRAPPKIEAVRNATQKAKACKAQEVAHAPQKKVGAEAKKAAAEAGKA